VQEPAPHFPALQVCPFGQVPHKMAPLQPSLA
jgi:hypothetical protein